MEWKRSNSQVLMRRVLGNLKSMNEYGVNQDLIRHEQVRRNSEFGTSGGFEFPDERASVLYWNEWHKRRLRLRVR